MIRTPDLLWPTRDDYRRAMQEYYENILDAKLKQGVLKNMNTHMLNLSNPNSHACVYRIDNTIIRCFCRSVYSEPPPGIRKRYQDLEGFCIQNQPRVSALIPIKYIPNGITVHFFDEHTRQYIKTEIMPFVTMDFVPGYQLNTFIATNYQISHKMHMLSDAWVRMIYEMEAVRMAHGDLDLTNVIVQHEPSISTIQLKLIDYDNTWIPEFERDYELPEHGHRPFQHPAFFGTSKTFNQEIDRFAALVIYISLKALELRPGLYKDYGADDNRLLFTHTDYKSEQEGIPANITQLKTLQLEGLDEYIEELRSSLLENRMPVSLETIAARQRNRPQVVLTPQQPSLQQQSPAQAQDLRNAVVLPEGYHEVIQTDWNNIRPRKVSPQPPRVTPSPATPSSPQQPAAQQQQPAESPAPIASQAPRPMSDRVRHDRRISPPDAGWQMPVPYTDRNKNKEHAKQQKRQESSARQPTNASSPPSSEQSASDIPDYHYEPGDFSGYNEPTDLVTPYGRSRKRPTERVSPPNYAGIGILVVAVVIVALILLFALIHGNWHVQTPYEYLPTLIHTQSHPQTHMSAAARYAYEEMIL